MADGDAERRTDPTIVSGGITAAVMTVVVWVVETRWQIQIPADVAAAMTAILSTIVASITHWRQKRGKSA